MCDRQEVEVSIICNAYNHAAYIEDTLKGFLMQKTSFAFEVLIHDDASCDGTRDIIEKYAKNYPDIVFPWYQTENQYSQRVSITKQFQYPRARGKYIAFCEGDDYWTDCEKLQKQYELLEKHPDVGICAHAVNMVNADTKEIINVISPYAGETIIPLERIIKGEYVGTCSLMFRKECVWPLSDLLNNMHFDYTMRLQGATPGGMLYIDSVMACYRWESNGSWTKLRKGNLQKIALHERKIVKALEVYNAQTNYRYSKVVEKEIEILKTKAMLKENNNRVLSTFCVAPMKNKKILLSLVSKKLLNKWSK